MTTAALDNLPTDGQVAAVEGNGKQANDYIANDLGKEKKACGGTYQCETCGTDYVAKTVWQKYCPTCSKERKRQVLFAKSRKAQVNG